MHLEDHGGREVQNKLKTCPISIISVLFVVD